MKKKLTILIAGATLVFSNGAFAQSQETPANKPVAEPTTSVEVITTSDAKTVKKAAPVNRTDTPIEPETIMDRQKKDTRISKRDPKK